MLIDSTFGSSCEPFGRWPRFCGGTEANAPTADSIDSPLRVGTPGTFLAHASVFQDNTAPKRSARDLQPLFETP
ncbi:hypothetical protein RISK_002991 [Rhodopirellula islandica]|uniref:Uncharacterized protein n=1 Tax=Rhodopirellula islandica TaxID=595434 RepID=A0A0J1BEI6_RHOIS|nr:hypothetical protein RISK_002991 [Rhodopirellula islandica]